MFSLLAAERGILYAELVCTSMTDYKYHWYDHGDAVCSTQPYSFPWQKNVKTQSPTILTP